MTTSSISRPVRLAYRKAASEDGMPIFYPESATSLFRANDLCDGTDGEDPVPTLSHTAVYRWITTLGGQNVATTAGGAKVAAWMQVANAGKVRSEGREQVLLNCALLLEETRRRR